MFYPIAVIYFLTCENHTIASQSILSIIYFQEDQPNTAWMKQQAGFSFIDILLSLFFVTGLISSFAYLQGQIRISAAQCLSQRTLLAEHDHAHELHW